jgi:hypothetical protein
MRWQVSSGRARVGYDRGRARPWRLDVVPGAIRWFAWADGDPDPVRSMRISRLT